MLFFTGYPGFLGSELIKSILSQNLKVTAICLVQKKFLALAEQHRAELATHIKERVELVEGDITFPDLGLKPSFLSAEAPKITQIFHLAAVYDLNVKEELATRINVTGTINTLLFAKQCSNLKRFHYVSTCYVSGRYEGRFYETDLDKGQTFNNFYESTKFLAEVEVQKAMKGGLPTTIYRPAIVVGNSQTGETQKFDGPYFVLQWLLRQPKLAILPTVFTSGMPEGGYSLDLVPSDFVINSISFLSQQPSTLNEVFQLADPNPLKVSEIIENFGLITGKKIVSISLPLSVARFSLKNIPGVQKFMGVPYSALNYFAHPTTYDVSHSSKHLAGSGISVPPFTSYSAKLLEFMKANRDVRSQAMV